MANLHAINVNFDLRYENFNGNFSPIRTFSESSINIINT